jgi:agmatine/peptidylarginine deiminase
LGILSNDPRILYCQLPSNDTWARDHGGIAVFRGESPVIYDFVFNGWGLKYASALDNQITRGLFDAGVFASHVTYANMSPFVLEGGSIESDGFGTIMTTESCLCSLNRNDHLTKPQIESCLKDFFGVHRILWLDHGHLIGDDTDGHIDTLTRFCDAETIAYVQCADSSDEHYANLCAMELQLKTFRTLDGRPYRLIPLPMAAPVYDTDGHRLPATYANFAIINGAVLLPFYRSPLDETARATLQSIFSDRRVIGIDCLPLLLQHGSLHCLTMQYPIGFINE